MPIYLIKVRYRAYSGIGYEDCEEDRGFFFNLEEAKTYVAEFNIKEAEKEAKKRGHRKYADYETIEYLGQ